MTQPATMKDQMPPCGKDCDSCGKGETCEALTPVLQHLTPVQQTRQPEAVSWK